MDQYKVKSEKWKECLPREQYKLKSENWKVKRVFAEGAIQIEKWKLKSEKGVRRGNQKNWKVKIEKVFAEGAIQIENENWKMKKGFPRDQYKVKSERWKECSPRRRRTIEAPTTSENHRSKQNVSLVRQNFMVIPLLLKLFSMAWRLVSFLGQVFENTAKAILFAPRRRGGNLSMVSFSCSTALTESPPFNSTKYWSAYSSLSNKLSHLEPSAAVKTQPSNWMAR